MKKEKRLERHELALIFGGAAAAAAAAAGALCRRCACRPPAPRARAVDVDGSSVRSVVVHGALWRLGMLGYRTLRPVPQLEPTRNLFSVTIPNCRVNLSQGYESIEELDE